MNREEIEKRIMLCDQKASDYLEIGNTKTAEKYNSEKYKWEKLLNDLELLDERKIVELSEYKKGYYVLEKENQKLKNKLDKAIELLIASEYKQFITNPKGKETIKECWLSYIEQELEK